MKIRILSAGDVRRALPMAAAIEAMRSAFGQFSDGKATVPLRERVPTQKGVTLLMSAYLHQSGDFGTKIVSIYPDNPQLNLPTVTATVLVLDSQTGQPRAFMEGDSLTAIRTGATGGLAADLLARKSAGSVALFGAGIQARTQLEAVMAVRTIEQVHVFDISRPAAQRLATDIAAQPGAPRMVLAATPAQAVAAADIVIAATTSKTPVFDGRDLRPGTHVTGVGSFSADMQEIDATAVGRATVVVDSRQSCHSEAGDLIAAQAKIAAELGEIINGDHPGRRSDDEITFFKSVGLAVQDAVAATEVLRQSERLGLGTLLEMS